MVANSAVGVILFTTYGYINDTLQNKDKSFEFYQPFVAGFISGVAQSGLAVPLENIQNHIQMNELIENRQKGMIRVTYDAIKQVMPSGFWKRVRFLYHRGFLTCMRDSLGFTMFFGVYEGARHVLKGIVGILYGAQDPLNLSDEYAVLEQIRNRFKTWKRIEEMYQGSLEEKQVSFTIANAAAVITSGAIAGMAYQLVTYPLDRVKPFLLHEFRERGEGHLWRRVNGRLRGTRRVLKKHGVSSFFRGIRGQLIRTMPPSALGLLVYELASNHFWDNRQG
jgi:hypothetical protein